MYKPSGFGGSAREEDVQLPISTHQIRPVLVSIANKYHHTACWRRGSCTVPPPSHAARYDDGTGAIVVTLLVEIVSQGAASTAV